MRYYMVECLIADKQKRKIDKRVTCKAALGDINRSNDNCSIVLKKKTFNIFSDYMSTNKNKNPGRYVSSTIYGVVQSGLTHMYHMSSKTMERDFKEDLSHFMPRMKIVVLMK